MTMTAKGLAKLAEELGELQQVVGKMLAYGSGAHPDGTHLLSRFEDESADVAAALTFVSQQFGANSEKVKLRSATKLALFQKWHADPDEPSPVMPTCVCDPSETGAAEVPCKKPDYRFDPLAHATYCHTCGHDRACHSSAVEG